VATSFEGAYSGSTRTGCWIVGGGPSLTALPCEQIAASPLPKFCVNLAGHGLLRPTFWTAYDPTGRFQKSTYLDASILKLLPRGRAMDVVPGTTAKVCDSPNPVFFDRDKTIGFRYFLTKGSREVTDRQASLSAPAWKRPGRKAFEMAGIGIDDVDLIDLYSCFPVAGEIGAEALGLDLDDPRGLTVTGGLPYAGGPGNNYVMHSVAVMLHRLRERRGEYGLITGNGRYLTKQSNGIHPPTRPDKPFQPPDPPVVPPPRDHVVRDCPRRKRPTRREGRRVAPMESRGAQAPLQSPCCAR